MDATQVQLQRRLLQARCDPLAGHGRAHAADELERVAAHIREHGIGPDVYGKGAYIEAFEAEVAALLGKPAARWMPSGCMAQPIALRIWADRSGNPATAFHPTSHLELHEEHGYRELHGLEAHLLGDPSRPTLARDLKGLPAVSSLLVELPAREIGGQLPTWGELNELVEAGRERGIRLHLDGARLWEAQAFYERPHAEVCALFDSVYVSFYKGVGGLAGAMLAGPTDFIAQAAIWQRRQGGTLYSALPNVVSARTRLTTRLGRMPLYRHRARHVGGLFATHGIGVVPSPPQVNMFHLHVPVTADVLLSARDEVAEETEIWLFGGAREVDGHCRVEITVGEAALGLDDGRLERAVAMLASFVGG